MPDVSIVYQKNYHFREEMDVMIIQITAFKMLWIWLVAACLFCYLGSVWNRDALVVLVNPSVLCAVLEFFRVPYTVQVFAFIVFTIFFESCYKYVTQNTLDTDKQDNKDHEG